MPGILQLPLIETGWPDNDIDALRWSRWIEQARSGGPAEELHAIQAVIAGQGVGICSHILVRQELASGELIRVSDVTLDGYGFFSVHRLEDSRKEALAALRASLMAAVGA